MTSTIDTNGARTLASKGDTWKTSPDASDNTGHLGAQVATVHRCSQTLTDGHRSNIWPPGTMPLDSLCEQGQAVSPGQPAWTTAKDREDSEER